MAAPSGSGNWLVFNGEIYNYQELRSELGLGRFKTKSDTETILVAYETWGEQCVEHLRGMFAFALWDEKRHRLFCARDRIGIKPFYYCSNRRGEFVFASEAKALLPFLDDITINRTALREYFTFQLCLDSRTMFDGISELAPAHTLTVERGVVSTQRYWRPEFHRREEISESDAVADLRALLHDATREHLIADVPIGGTLSGGLDSSAVSALAISGGATNYCGFTGFVDAGQQFDERRYAHALGAQYHFPIHEIALTPDAFITHIRDVMYHLDYPVAGIGSFNQYMVSRYAGAHRKVVLGGQGADELFGGYARYLLAYFEQAIKGAINGTNTPSRHIVSLETVTPNLQTLKEYQPMMKEFWSSGLFESGDARYFSLVNRRGHLTDEVRWETLPEDTSWDTFLGIFNAPRTHEQAYLDRMLAFDTTTLLPGLLHIEDRMSMAHGIESRVPFLDHRIVEFAASVPANVKFKGGVLKHLLREALRGVVPDTILDRKDKMGFPLPFSAWSRGPLREFIHDLFSSQRSRERDYINADKILASLGREGTFGRATWGLLSLELWCELFIDERATWRYLRERRAAA